MKIINFLFNYLYIPLLPLNKNTIIFLSLAFRFPFSYFIFHKYVKICLNKRENKRVVFVLDHFIFRRKFPLEIIEIYLYALRNLELHKKCIKLSKTLINFHPESDIGYWHLIHSFIAINKVEKAEKVFKLYKTKLFKSQRIFSLCLGDSLINKIIDSSGINRNSDFFNLFLSDSRLAGQSLLKISTKTYTLEKSPLCLFISSHGGFSNTLIALINTIALAKILNISEIYIIKSYLTLSLNLDKLNIQNLEIKTCDLDLNDNKNFISGNFFSHFNFINLHNPKFSKERLNYASQILNNYALKELGRNNELVIHIRSGDIFNERIAHRKYGQPPLSYYKLCIKHFNPKSIRLIFEEYSNPVINLLIKYIYTLGCKLEIDNDNSLKKDISILLRSENIICGNGTFVPGILLGSKMINNLYLFEPSDNFKIYWSLQRVKNMFKVVDINGFYKKAILNNNWKASKSQLSLMKNYPSSNLKLTLF